jgi:hypothetical protein
MKRTQDESKRAGLQFRTEEVGPPTIKRLTEEIMKQNAKCSVSLAAIAIALAICCLLLARGGTFDANYQSTQFKTTVHLQADPRR